MLEDVELAPQTKTLSTTHKGSIGRTLLRVGKYMAVRAVTLLLVVFVGVYITLLIASKGGPIESELTGSQLTGWFGGVFSPGQAAPSSRTPEMEGPLLVRNFYLTLKGMTFNLGDSRTIYIYSSAVNKRDVKSIILDTLPRTLLVFGSANLLLFVSSIALALPLARSYGKWIDRVTGFLASLTSAPAWIYGLILTLLMVRVFRVYVGGILDAWPDQFSWSFMVFLLKAMLIPVSAVFLSKFFQSIYAWRTFFLIYSGEDFIELAKAKGLPPRDIERRYIMRPALPHLITSFAVLMIMIWQEAIVIELFFKIAGIGQLFYRVLQIKDLPIVAGIAVVFAYLLAATVFVLDLAYALVDPRVNIASSSNSRPRTLRSRRIHFRHMFRRPPDALPRHPSRERLVSPVARGTSRERLSASLHSHVDRWKQSFRKLRYYPSAALGLFFVLVLAAFSTFAVASVPLKEAIRYWNYANVEWEKNPVKASPLWFNWFRQDKLPTSINMSTRSGQIEKQVARLSADMIEINAVFTFDYQFDGFPQDIYLTTYSKYDKKLPFVTLYWTPPGGEEREITNFQVQNQYRYRAKDDKKLARRLAGQSPVTGLFTGSGGTKVVKGPYQLRVSGLVFEDGADLDYDFNLYGQVHGWAGTDFRRRDLSIALLWGAPVALAFGIIGAAGTTLLTLLIAAVGAWFGGWLDTLIQRITEVNMILPVFPILLIIYVFYSKSFWAILGVAVLLNIFSSGIKTYRATFIQEREAPYIEAARSYGASSGRLIVQYLIPRILPVMVPQLVILVPTFVYLEATMAYLNMGDPLLPTWGKIIQEGLNNGALDGAYYWVLQPAFILVFTGMTFYLLGTALERMLNPRLMDT